MTAQSTAPEVLHVWALYLRASEEARRRGDRRVGTDHLVLATLEDPAVEVTVGVTLEQARAALHSLDRSALGSVGVGLDVEPVLTPMRAVPEKPTMRDVMRKDRLRMTPAAKKVLQDAVRPNRRKSQVTAHQVLGRILQLAPPDPAAALLDALGLRATEIQSRLDVSTLGV